MPYETIETKDGGSFKAYVAMPAKTPAPGLVVIQEIFGVNQVMRELTDAYAAAGYLAICPDIFWRIEPGVDITDQSEAERSEEHTSELQSLMRITYAVCRL